MNQLNPPVPEHHAPRPDVRRASCKGGTLIAEHVHDLVTHERLLVQLDGYRPDLCLHCGGKVLHAHDYVERKPRGAPDGVTEIRVRRYICANKDCQATWRILPAFVARRLWRVWPTVEHTVSDALPPPPPAPPPPCTPPTPSASSVPERTARRWRERLAARARQLVVLLATSGGALLEAIAKRAGLDATRFELVGAYAHVAATPRARRLADLAALIHRLHQGLRLV